MFHVLFLCTHNRCRSILCEVIANHLAEGVFRASSAGSEPAGAVHPMTLQHLERRGYPTLGVRSKSMEEFSGDLPDLMVTVCDSAAAEACPVGFSGVPRLHWPLKDPSRLTDPSAQEAAFDEAIERIEQQVAEWQGLARLSSSNSV